MRAGEPRFPVQSHQFAHLAQIHPPRRHQRLLPQRRRRYRQGSDNLTCAAPHRIAAPDQIGTLHATNPESAICSRRDDCRRKPGCTAEIRSSYGSGSCGKPLTIVPACADRAGLVRLIDSPKAHTTPPDWFWIRILRRNAAAVLMGCPTSSADQPVELIRRDCVSKRARNAIAALRAHCCAGQRVLSLSAAGPRGGSGTTHKAKAAPLEEPPISIADLVTLCLLR